MSTATRTTTIAPRRAQPSNSSAAAGHLLPRRNARGGTQRRPRRLRRRGRRRRPRRRVNRDDHAALYLQNHAPTTPGSSAARACCSTPTPTARPTGTNRPTTRSPSAKWTHFTPRPRNCTPCSSPRPVTSSPNLAGLERLEIPETLHEVIRRSWDNDEWEFYGRFDFTFDRLGTPKLIEYNADTPTGLLEAAIIQWYWKEDIFPRNDQFNSIHESLVGRWGRVDSARANRAWADPLHLDGEPSRGPAHRRLRRPHRRGSRTHLRAPRCGPHRLGQQSRRVRR